MTGRDMQRPEPPPEAVLIRLVREASQITIADAANAAGISKSRWSQIETGYESRSGEYKEVTGQRDTIAWMAWAVGLERDRLGEYRPDAVLVLDEILRRHGPREGIDNDGPLARIAATEGLEPEEAEAFINLAKEMRAARLRGQRRSA